MAVVAAVAEVAALPDISSISPQRQTILDVVAASCGKNPQWAAVDIKKQRSIVRRIERSCYRAAIHVCEADRINRTWEEPAFVERYSSYCYRVIANLDSGSSVGSTYLTNMIITDEIKLSDIGNASSDILFPAGSMAERDIIATRREQKIEQKFSEKYKCSKCHARKCTWYGVQTRGLDEPEDKYCRCIECGFAWKEGG